MTQKQREEYGRMAPLRAVVARLEARQQAERELRPADDPVLAALGMVRDDLTAALAEAAQPTLDLDAATVARMEGVSRSAIYKRVYRGKMDARKQGSRVLFPAGGR